MANLLSGGGEPSSRDKEPRDVKDENEPLDVSEFELPDFEDGSCPCCMQKFGNQDKDAPANMPLLCTACKANEQSLCTKCFYVKRGSFQKLNLKEFLKLIHGIPQLKQKFENLRRRHVVAICQNPRAKPRHEPIDVKLYTTKKTSKYLDFFSEGEWVAVDTYFQEKAPPEAKKRHKTFAAKRSWIKEKGLEIQQDDRGIEGVIILPDDKRRKVRVGTKMSTESGKSHEHEDRESRDLYQAKNEAALAIASNTQEQESAALGVIDEPMPEEMEKSDSEGGQSSDDGFGVATGAKSKGQHSKLKEEDGKPQDRDGKPQTEKPKKRKEPGASADSAAKAKAKEKLQTQARTAIAAFQQVTPLGIWQGKRKDAEAKISKAQSLIQSLQGQADSDCDAQAKLLQEQVCEVERSLELLSIEYQGKTAEELQKLDDSYLARASELPADCLNAMLSDFGRGILEDAATQSQTASNEGCGSGDCYFFDFIRFVDTGLKGFSMFALFSRVEAKACTLERKDLFRMQHALFVLWLDKVTKLQEVGVNAFITGIPESLWNPEFVRKCAGHPVHDDLHADDPMTGLSPRIVVDMHKFLAAAHMTKEDLVPSLPLLDGLKSVAGMSSSCSPRVNLMFRSSNQLKTLWTKVLEQSKNAVVQELAVKSAGNMISELGKLNDLLEKFQQGKEKAVATQIVQAVGQCRNAMDLREACQRSEEPEAAEKVKELDAAIEKLSNLFNESFRWSDCVKIFADSLLFENSLSIHVEKLSFRETDVDLETFFDFLLIEGNVGSLVLQKDLPLMSSLLELEGALRSYHKTCAADDPKTLSDCCAFQLQLEKVAMKVSRVHQEGKPAWCDAVAGAYKRFCAALSKAGPIQCVLKDTGIEAAGNYVFSCKNLTTSLKPYSAILVQASFLKNLSVPAEMDKKDPKLLEVTTGHIKNYVTLKTLDTKGIEFLFPEASETALKFEEAVQAQVAKIAERIGRWCKNCDTVLQDFRCLFTAIDTWQLEAVQWMLKDNKDVDDAVENMMKFWNTTTDYQTFFQNAIAVQAPALKDDQLFSPLASVLKTLQDLRVETSKLVSCLCVTQTIVRHESDETEKQLCQARQVGAFLAKTFGYSSKDLPASLKARFEEFGKQKPVESEKPKKRKGQKDQKEPKAKPTPKK